MAKKKTQKIKMKTKTIKSEAKTKKGAAQAQTTAINIKIGDTKKRPRRRQPAKKGPPPQPTKPDGWLPPQNLMRNGAVFTSQLEDRYIRGYQPTAFVAGPPVEKPTFTESVGGPKLVDDLLDFDNEAIVTKPPDIPSYFDLPEIPEPELEPEPEMPEDSGFNVTEFLRQAKEGKKGRDIYEPPDYFLQSYKPKEKKLIEYKSKEPSFLDITSTKIKPLEEVKEEVVEIPTIEETPILETSFEEPIEAKGEEGIVIKNKRYAKKLQKDNLLKELELLEDKLLKGGYIQYLKDLEDNIYDGQRRNKATRGVDKLQGYINKIKKIYGV